MRLPIPYRTCRLLAILTLPVALLLPAALAAPPAKKPAPKAPVKKPAAAPAKPAAAADLMLSGPMDVLLLERQKRASLSHTELDTGGLSLLFDGNPRTYARAGTAPAPAPRQAFCQVALDVPRAVDEVNVVFGEGAAHRWSVAAADTLQDMQGKRGSYRVMVPGRTPPDPAGDRALFQKPRPYRVYRLECERLAGEGGPALAEWILWTPQKLSKMEITAPVPEVGSGSLLPLRANGTFEAGGRQNMTPDVTWEISPRTRGTVDAFSRFNAAEAGPARITAVYHGVRSKPLDLVVHPDARPDWDVTFIERQPRLNYEAGETLKARQSVSWFAHVKNYGTGEAPPVKIEWRVDGQPVSTGRLPKIARFGQSEAMYSEPWDGRRHQIELVVDPQNEVAETCEENNVRRVSSDALSVGFWVEESLVNYFHRHQRALNAGSNSWEDWAQRQIEYWNAAMDRAPDTGDPQAPREKWRLDRITIVGDGMLPLAGGSPVTRPDGRDRSVHLMLGFPAYEAVFTEQYHRTADKSPENPFFVQPALLHSIDEVRYHRLAYRPPTPRGRPRAGWQPEAEEVRARPFERKMRRPR